MKRLEIAVAGAGPGGLAAALALTRAGHRVVVYEQFDAPKPVGSGLILQPTGLAVLDWLGLGETIRNRGARIDRLSGTSSKSGRTVLDVRYEALGSSRGLAVHRAALFDVLFGAVRQAGISIETNSVIKGLNDSSLVLHEGRTTPRFDFIIDALGAKSPLRNETFNGVHETQLAYGAIWMSLPWPGAPFDPHALTQRYDQARVMIGVLPIGKVHEGGEEQAAFFWSLKADAHGEWKARGLDAWKDEILQHWPETAAMLHNIKSPDDLTLARYQHHTLDVPFGRKLVCIGDSAHSTSPQLGQGANNALLDVMALVAALGTHADLGDVFQAYAKSRRRHVKVYQALSYLFTPFYQSDSIVLPWLRDGVVSGAANVPMARRLLARMVAGTIVKAIR